MVKMAKPFKTREGGVVCVWNVSLEEINEEMFKKIVNNRSVKDENAQKTTHRW